MKTYYGVRIMIYIQEILLSKNYLIRKMKNGKYISFFAINGEIMKVKEKNNECKNNR